jgi:hypothetical protein
MRDRTAQGQTAVRPLQTAELDGRGSQVGIWGELGDRALAIYIPRFIMPSDFIIPIF